MTELDERIKKVADWLLSTGVSVVPIGEDKKPSIAWSQLIDEPLKEWSFENCNIAIITGAGSGVAVIDFDDDGYLWWMKNRPKTPLMTRTKRGVHFFYRHPGEGTYIKSDSHVQAAEGVEHDVKGDRSICLIPPSWRSSHQYHFIINEDNPRGTWIDPQKLPLFQMEWRPERAVKEWNETNEIKDVRAYISKIFANEGSGGDKLTYKVICILKENQLDEVSALALLCEWNQTNATPPWSVNELLRKIKRVF